jgi:hypothetical protein
MSDITVYVRYYYHMGVKHRYIYIDTLYRVFQCSAVQHRVAL